MYLSETYTTPNAPQTKGSTGRFEFDGSDYLWLASVAKYVTWTKL